MNKLKLKTPLLIFLAFSLLLVAFSSYITSAFIITDSYKIVGEIIGGGNVNLTNYSGGTLQNKSQIALGQPIIGITQNTTANLKLCLGLFCMDTYQSQYTMNFSGTLYYSNGSAVVSAPIKITINSQFSGSSWTDGLGKFFVNVYNLPSYLMGQDLNITFNVQGEVEANYNCWYNHSSTNCCKIPVIAPC